jgi:heme/copper-type cytochrome/quinol oxidase subunit 3
MSFFVASEAFFFLALIIAYAFYGYPEGRVAKTASYLDVEKTGVFTLFLLSSSFSMLIAEKYLKKDKIRAATAWLLGTIILGLVFLIGQSMEYLHLFSIEITISKNVFGSAFFTLTGFHGLHVIIGLIVLSVITYLVYSGKYRKLGNTAIAPASIYWHFVDAVWIIVFTVVYLGSMI